MLRTVISIPPTELSSSPVQANAVTNQLSLLSEFPLAILEISSYEANQEQQDVHYGDSKLPAL